MYYFTTTKTGYGHIKNNRRRDDSVVCRKLTDNIIFTAVSDGAGSASLSAYGAYTITDCLASTFSNVEILKKYISAPSNYSLDKILDILLDKKNKNELSKLINDIVHDNISKLCKETKFTHNVFSATLVGCFIKDDREIITVHIGDGFVCVYSKGDHAGKFISKPDNIDNYMNRTHFITEPNSNKHTRITYYDNDFDCVLISTDGLNKFFNDKTICEKLLPFLADAEIIEDSDLYNFIFSEYDKKDPAVVSDDCGIAFLCKEYDTQNECIDNNSDISSEDDSTSQKQLESLNIFSDYSDANLDKLLATISRNIGNIKINNLNIYLGTPSRKDLKEIKKKNKISKHRHMKGNESSHETKHNLSSS